MNIREIRESYDKKLRETLVQNGLNDFDIYYDLSDKSRFPRGIWDIQPDMLRIKEKDIEYLIQSSFLCIDILDLELLIIDTSTKADDNCHVAVEQSDKLRILKHEFCGTLCSCLAGADGRVWYPALEYTDKVTKWDSRCRFAGIDTEKYIDTLKMIDVLLEARKIILNLQNENRHEEK